MIFGSYSVKVEKLIKEVMRRNCKRILLQAPDGLKKHMLEISDLLEEKGIEVLLSTDPCFGACDVSSIYYAGALDIDMVVQIGHLPMPSLKVPVMYVNAEGIAREEEGVKKAIPELRGSKIGLVANAQHVNKLEKVSKILRREGFEVFIGKGDERIYRDGLVLGCNFSSATSISKHVDAFLFIGSGFFHPVGLSMVTSKRVVAVDPFTLKVFSEEIEREKNDFLKRRYAVISLAKDAECFGIIVGIKPGQLRKEKAFEIKKKLERYEKKAYIFVVDNLNQSALDAFSGIDCFVSTLCPRVAIDNVFKVPLINPSELEIVLGEREDYVFETLK